MPAIVVPVRKTSYNSQEMIEGFIKGWFKQFGEIPKKECIGVIWSQNAIETGSTTSMWNNNIGNVKYVPNKNPELDNDITYMMLNNVWEIINGKKIIYQPPHPATWFRSFNTLEDGVAFHLDLLKNHRYKNSWKAVESGDPKLFAHLLKVSGYYTAPEPNYVQAIMYYFNKFMKDSTFDNVVVSLKPEIKIDPITGNGTVTGDLNLVKPSTTWNKITNIFSGIFGNK